MFFLHILLRPFLEKRIENKKKPFCNMCFIVNRALEAFLLVFNGRKKPIEDGHNKKVPSTEQTNK